MNTRCRKCGIILTTLNQRPSCIGTYNHICINCQRNNELEQRGGIPYTKNPKCGAYLGIYVAERVLSHVFKEVRQMPYGNKGFDFICNKGKKIDVKSSCMRIVNNWLCLSFTINKNKIADYFLFLGFDDRKHLNPIKLWLIPSIKINRLSSVSIGLKNPHKWDKYELPIEEVTACCDVMRQCPPSYLSKDHEV